MGCVFVLQAYAEAINVVAEALSTNKGMDAAKIQVSPPARSSSQHVDMVWYAEQAVQSQYDNFHLMARPAFAPGGMQIAKEYIQMYGLMGSQSNTMLFSDRCEPLQAYSTCFSTPLSVHINTFTQRDANPSASICTKGVHSSRRGLSRSSLCLPPSFFLTGCRAVHRPGDVNALMAQAAMVLQQSSSAASTPPTNRSFIPTSATQVRPPTRGPNWMFTLGPALGQLTRVCHNLNIAHSFALITSRIYLCV